MKVGQIVNSRETLNKLYQMETDGVTALKLRRCIKPLMEEIQNFDEIKNNFIKKNGKDMGDGQIGITPDHPQFPEFAKLMEDMAGNELEVKADAILTEENIRDARFSAGELDSLIVLGLFKE